MACCRDNGTVDVMVGYRKHKGRNESPPHDTMADRSKFYHYGAADNKIKEDLVLSHRTQSLK